MPPIYRPDPLVDVRSVEDLVAYIQREQQKVSDALMEAQAGTAELLASPPQKVEENLIVGADGVNWNPGQGKGMYIYQDGFWHFLGGSGRVDTDQPPPPPPTSDAPIITLLSPDNGAVGTNVTITGTNLIGTTSVQFNGTGAAFTIVSNTQINTSVPNGATTGKVQLVHPNGNVLSPGNFTVSAPAGGGPPAGAGLTIEGAAVCTFHSIGLYWTPPSVPIGNEVRIRFAKLTDTAWRTGHSMWYDSRNTSADDYGRPAEARGSVVECDSGTPYIVQFGMPQVGGGTNWVAEIRPITWSELGDAIPAGGYGPVEGERITTLPPATTIRFKGTRTSQSGSVRLLLNKSGTPDAWTVYDFTGQSIDAPLSWNAIAFDGAYIILRGLNVTGGFNSVFIQPGSHDILIERNSFSKWGSGATMQYTLESITGGTQYTRGVDEAAAILIPHGSYGSVQEFLDTKRIIVQRNTFHDPNFGNNGWEFDHPHGPSPIELYPNGGNHVFRYNTVYSTTNDQVDGPPNYSKFFCDAFISGGENGTLGGIGRDIDIYKNLIMHAMDDGCEIDGGGCNIRVWKNYVDYTACGFSSTPCGLGPAYFWRNVYNRCRKLYNEGWGAESDRLQMFKVGGMDPLNDGRRYLYHNTAMQFPWEQQVDAGTTGPRDLGCANGMAGTGGAANYMGNTVSRNNVIETSGPSMVDSFSGVQNSDFDYDVCNNDFGITESANGKPNAVITFATGHGPLAGFSGKYQLATTSEGYHNAVLLNNFNDIYATPDRGAHQSGTADMDFGVNATGK